MTFGDQSNPTEISAISGKVGFPSVLGGFASMESLTIAEVLRYLSTSAKAAPIETMHSLADALTSRIRKIETPCNKKDPKNVQPGFRFRTVVAQLSAISAYEKGLPRQGLTLIA